MRAGLTIMKMAGDAQEDRETKIKILKALMATRMTMRKIKIKKEEGNRVSPAGRNRDRGKSRLLRDRGYRETRQRG